jgi:predicted small lipoprotein YifL
MEFDAMKRFFSLFLALSMVFTLCSCGYIPEEVKQEAADALGEAFDESVKDAWDDYVQVLKDEIKNRFKDHLQTVPEDMKSVLHDQLQELGADALTEPNVLSSTILGKEYVSLVNFPRAKIMAVLHEYPIGTKFPDPSDKTSETFKLTIDGDTVAMGSMQCQAYARYIQYKLYGKTDYTASSEFRNVIRDITGSNTIPDGTLTKDLLKEVITAAGPGTHIRTDQTPVLDDYGNVVYNSKGEIVYTSRHSMFVVQVDEEGFTILEANWDNTMTIRQHYYTWDTYMSSGFAKRGLKFVNVYDPKE